MNQTSTDAFASSGDLSVRKSTVVEAAPDKVWSAIGDFSGIAHWHPAVDAAKIETREGRTVRVLTLKDGATLEEELLAWDDEARSYTYKILEGPLPVERYVSTLSVTSDESGGTRLDWQGTFDAKGTSNDEASGVISSIYESGLAALAEAVRG